MGILNWKKLGFSLVSAGLLAGFGMSLGESEVEAADESVTDCPITMDVVPYDVQFHTAPLDDTFGDGNVDESHAKKDGYVRTNDVIGFKAKFENIRSTDGLKYENIKAYLVVNVEDNLVEMPDLVDHSYLKVPIHGNKKIGFNDSSYYLDGKLEPGSSNKFQSIRTDVDPDTIYYPRITNQSSKGTLETGMSVSPPDNYQMYISTLPNNTKLKTKFYVRIFSAVRVDADGKKEPITFENARVAVSNPFGELTIASSMNKSDIGYNSYSYFNYASIQDFTNVSLDDNDYETYRSFKGSVSSAVNLFNSVLWAPVGQSIYTEPVEISTQINLYSTLGVGIMNSFGEIDPSVFLPEVVGYARYDGTYKSLVSNSPVDVSVIGKNKYSSLKEVKKVSNGVYKVTYSVSPNALNGDNESIGSYGNFKDKGLPTNSIVFKLNALSEQYLKKHPDVGTKLLAENPQVLNRDQNILMVLSNRTNSISAPMVDTIEIQGTSSYPWSNSSHQRLEDLTDNAVRGSIWQGNLSTINSSNGIEGSYVSSSANGDTLKSSVGNKMRMYFDTRLIPISSVLWYANTYHQKEAYIPDMQGSALYVGPSWAVFDEDGMRQEARTSLTANKCEEIYNAQLVAIDKGSLEQYDRLFDDSDKKGLNEFSYAFYDLDATIPSSKKVVGQRFVLKPVSEWTIDKKDVGTRTVPVCVGIADHRLTIPVFSSTEYELFDLTGKSINTDSRYNIGYFDLRYKSIDFGISKKTIKNLSKNGEKDIFSPDIVKESLTIKAEINPKYEHLEGVDEFYRSLYYNGGRTPTNLPMDEIAFAFKGVGPLDIVSVEYDGNPLSATDTNNVFLGSGSSFVKDMNGKTLSITYRLKNINSHPSTQIQVYNQSDTYYSYNELKSGSYRGDYSTFDGSKVIWIEPYYAGVNKYTSTPLVRNNQSFNYTIQAFNKYIEPVKEGSKILDVFPDQGDDRGSTIHGSFELENLEVTQTNGLLDGSSDIQLYTTTQKIPENIDLRNLSTSQYELKLYKGGKVSAKSIVAVLPEMPIGSNILIQSTLKGLNNVEGDCYVNQAQFGPTPGNTQNIVSNNVEVTVYEVNRKIQGKVFWDLANNGVLTDKLVQNEIPLTLYQQNEDGSETIVTEDADGNKLPALKASKGSYTISNLAPGTYFVAADLDKLFADNVISDISPFKNNMAFKQWNGQTYRTEAINIPDQEKFTATADLGLIGRPKFKGSVDFFQNDKSVNNQAIDVGTTLHVVETLTPENSGWFVETTSFEPKYITSIAPIANLTNIKVEKIAKDGARTDLGASVVNGHIATSAGLGSDDGSTYELSYDVAVGDTTPIARLVSGKASITGATSNITIDGKVLIDYITDVAPVYVAPKPKITKAVDKTEARVGDELTYTLTVINEQGGSNWYDVVLEDTIPEGTEYVANSTTLNQAAVADEDVFSNGKFAVDLGTVESGSAEAQKVVTFKVKIVSVPDSKQVVNTASATGKNANLSGASDVDSEASVSSEAKAGFVPVYMTIWVDESVKDLVIPDQVPIQIISDASKKAETVMVNTVKKGSNLPTTDFYQAVDNLDSSSDSKTIVNIPAYYVEEGLRFKVVVPEGFGTSANRTFNGYTSGGISAGDQLFVQPDVSRNITTIGHTVNDGGIRVGFALMANGFDGEYSLSQVK